MKPLEVLKQRNCGCCIELYLSNGEVLSIWRQSTEPLGWINPTGQDVTRLLEFYSLEELFARARYLGKHKCLTILVNNQGT